MATPRILVIGLGTLGRALVGELRRRDCAVWVVDQDETRTDRIKGEVERAVTMDATDSHALTELKVNGFDHVVVCLGSSFEAAERTSLVLEDLGVRDVINVATTRQRGEILKKLGSHRVVMPNLLQARNLAVELCDELIDTYRWIDEDQGLVEVALTERVILQGAEVEDVFGEGMRLVAVGRTDGDGRRRFDCALGERVEAAAGDSLLVFGPPADVAALVRKKLR